MNFYRIFIILFYTCCSVTTVSGQVSDSDSGVFSEQGNQKEGAFSVLRNKCNTCHATKKRTEVFTMQNMDSLASSIEEQVFIKKKMPKGRKMKLTDAEQMALKKWLTEVFKNRS